MTTAQFNIGRLRLYWNVFLTVCISLLIQVLPLLLPQFNIEGPVYWNAFLTVYIVAAAAIVGSIGTMLCRTPPSHNAIKSANAAADYVADGGVVARWRAKRLLVGSAVYFAVAPTLTLAIGVLWVKNGDVFGSSEVRNEEEGEKEPILTVMCFLFFCDYS